MDWLALQDTMPRDKRLPDRAFRLSSLEAVLDGKQYDGLSFPFSCEKGENGEYVPLDKRRPSARTNLCAIVVEDSVSLLFSEGHWPAVKAKNEQTVEALTLLIKERQINELMLEAATRGSVGSIAILFQVLKNKPFFCALSTAFLTPEWSQDDPTLLTKVTERYIVKGKDLVAMGYVLPADSVHHDFWFQREWNEQQEVWYHPVKITALGDDAVLRVDPERTVTHGLGFVPMIWARNLASKKKDKYDGACTFECAIDTVIEADYLLSQGGRGLKYASDPTLVIKQGPVPPGEEPARVGGAANALEVPPEGDAKLLEINGNAAKAVLEHVNQLRAIALESMHGNRSNADKLSAATSGRSIELMMTGLIWLADRLRISYGEGALLSLLRMVCAASAVIDSGLIINDKPYRNIDPDGLELRWATWMPPMPQDLLQTAQALVTAVDGRVISQETAAGKYGSLLDVDDAEEELLRIQNDMKAAAQAAQDLADATATRQAARIGQTTTRQATA